MEVTDEALAEIFSFVNPHLDEKQRRLLAGAIAKPLVVAVRLRSPRQAE